MISTEESINLINHTISKLGDSLEDQFQAELLSRELSKLIEKERYSWKYKSNDGTLKNTSLKLVSSRHLINIGRSCLKYGYHKKFLVVVDELIHRFKPTYGRDLFTNMTFKDCMNALITTKYEHTSILELTYNYFIDMYLPATEAYSIWR